MPLSPEDMRLGQLLRARGLVPEPILLECAREGDAWEAQGRPRPRLGAQLVARRAISPDSYARFLQMPSHDSSTFRVSGQLPSLGSSQVRQESGRLRSSGLGSSGVSPGISRSTPSPPTPPIGATPFPPSHSPVPPSSSPSPDSSTFRSRSGAGELPQIGSLVGPYRLEGELGRGGMGAVYRGKHERTGAVTAIKILARRAGGQTVERFEREVQAFAKLRHPNVVAIHESGEAPLYLWYSMELVEGNSLEKVVSEKKTERDGLVRLVLQVARGMEHAHSRGVIHRDLKPSNVLVTPEGVARVTDFGAARHLDRQTRLTADGSVVGTPYYMSPEQVTGSTNEIDERSDVWALGVILYEVVTGALPFEAEQPLELCAKICESDPERPRARSRSISADLEAVIVRALSKAKNERYATMAALATDLERYLRGERVSASQITLAHEILRHAKKRPRRLLGGLAVLALGIIALGVVVSRRVVERAATGSGSELAVEAEREAARALEKIRAGKLPVGDSLALATATLTRLEEVSRAPRAEAERKKLATWPVRLELVVARARSLITQGAEGEARAALEAVGETNTPADADLALALADACLALGDLPAAITAFDHAAARAPERWEPLLGRVRARIRAGDANGSNNGKGNSADLEKDLVAAKEKQAPSTLVETARAELMAARGDRAGALEKLDQVVKLDPVLAAPRVARALVLRDVDEARALEDLHKAADHDPAAARLEAAWHLEVGALADAAHAYERTLALVPEDVNAAVALAGLRAAMGELEHASVGLLHDAIPLAESRQKAGRPALVAFLHALTPIEGARGAWTEAFAQRLDAVGLVADGAVIHAELVGDPERARAILETALEAAHTPDDKAQIGAALASLLLHAGDGAHALDRAEAAVAAVPSNVAARSVRAAVLALSPDAAAHGGVGAIDRAQADREAAHALRSPAFVRALAEARADALVILDGAGRGVGVRRAEEARRGQVGRFPFHAVGPPAPDLLARADRELRYLVRLDPFASEPKVLVARLAFVTDALAHGLFAVDSDPLGAVIGAQKLAPGFVKPEPRAFALAAAAAEADPLDPDAAAVVAFAPVENEDAHQLALTAAAAKAYPSDVRLLMGLARHRYMINVDRTGVLADALRLAAEHPRDREILTFAVSMTTFGEDPNGARLEKELDTLDAEVDHARAEVLATIGIEHADIKAALAHLLPALATAPDDLEVVRTTIEKAKSQAKMHGADWSREPVLLCARIALMSGNDSGEVLRWLDVLRPYLSPDDETFLREQSKSASPHDRLVAQTAFALIDAQEPLNYDSRKLAFQGMTKGSPARECLARLMPVLAATPGIPLVRGLFAVQLARSGRPLSMTREVQRLVGWRAPTFNDLWLAAGAHVCASDWEPAAGYAARAIVLTDITANDKRDFVDYAPFLEAAKRNEWKVVLQASEKRKD